MTSFIKKWRKKAITMYGKARGLTKDQRARVTSATHGRKTQNPRASRKPRKVKRKMARKKRRRGGKSITQQVFKFIRIGALAGPGIYRAAYAWDSDHDIKSVARHVLSQYTGYDVVHGSWNPGEIVNGWGPYIIANVLTHGIPKLVGIIRRL